MQILLHSPYEYPEVRRKGFGLGMGKEAFIGVSAVHTERLGSVHLLLGVAGMK